MTKPTQPAGGCDTCAFRAGCITHEKEPHNRLKALICALGGLPFYCHYSDAGDWSSTSISKLNREESMTLRRDLPVCQGWKAEVKRLAGVGHFRKATRARRWVALHALRLVQRFIDSDNPEEKADVERDLYRALDLLAEDKNGRQ